MFGAHNQRCGSLWISYPLWIGSSGGSSENCSFNASVSADVVIEMDFTRH
jgi:hypothetical protein